MKKIVLLIIVLTGALLMSSTSGNAATIVSRTITYKDGNTSLTGYLYYDDAAKTKRPGIVVFPEWWGLTDYAKTRAEMLAKLGYVAFAADIYGTGIMAATPEEATKASAPFYNDRLLMRRRAKAALDVLKAQSEVDTTRLAAIGYCFGGTVALSLARAGADIKGVVSFHGGLATDMPAKAGTVKAQILALNGGVDPFVPPEQKEAFIKEMQAAGVTFKSIDYPGAEHAFTNPAATARGKEFNLPIAYNAQADKESWQAMKDFFAVLLK